MVLTAVNSKSAALWDVEPRGLLITFVHKFYHLCFLLKLLQLLVFAHNETNTPQKSAASI